MEHYNQMAEQAAEGIHQVVEPIWRELEDGRKDDFLGCLFRWGSLRSGVPVAVVPLGADLEGALAHIRRTILQEKQEFALPEEELRESLPDDLTGFQANWATNHAISRLLGEGFVAFPDQARLYSQYASSYLEKLDEHMDRGTGDKLSPQAVETLAALAMAYGVGNSYLTWDWKARASFAWSCMSDHFDLERYQLKNVRAALARRWPQISWDEWRPGKVTGGEAGEVLEKVNEYYKRTALAKEWEGVWARWQVLNEERLELWRAWWQENIVDALRSEEGIEWLEWEDTAAMMRWLDFLAIINPERTLELVKVQRDHYAAENDRLRRQDVELTEALREALEIASTDLGRLEERVEGEVRDLKRANTELLKACEALVSIAEDERAERDRELGQFFGSSGGMGGMPDDLYQDAASEAEGHIAYLNEVIGQAHAAIRHAQEGEKP